MQIQLSCIHLAISLTGGGGSSKGGGGAGSQGREVKTKKVNKKWKGRFKDEDDREDNDDEAGMYSPIQTQAKVVVSGYQVGFVF